MSRAGILGVSDHGGWAVLMTGDGKGTGNSTGKAKRRLRKQDLVLT
jgi:hypothetical protein